MSQNDSNNYWAVLNDWHRTAGLVGDAHYDSARLYANRNYWLGIPVIIFSTSVGTSIFATLQQDVHTWIRICIGAVSVASAILAGLQTFLRFAESAEKHHSAAVKYASICTDIEEIKALPESSRGHLKKVLDDLKRRKTTLEAESPDFPASIWKNYAQRFSPNGK
ncbi:MAG: SLATT domain-containing protein [Thermodesulfobacteriota bacterium]